MSQPIFRRIFVGMALLCGASAALAEVHRCGNAYSDTPCPGSRVVNTAPTMSDPRGPATREIFLCSAPQNRQYWSAEHCAQRGWTIQRLQRVPIDLPWPDQVAAAQREHREAEQASRAIPAPRAVAQAPVARLDCGLLEARVRQLDSMGRAGSRHYDLDWLRSERKAARDQQFRQRC